MYNTLTDLMTGICNAVREKEGSSELIPAPDIPERIRGIQSGITIQSKTSIHNFIFPKGVTADTYELPTISFSAKGESVTNANE